MVLQFISIYFWVTTQHQMKKDRKMNNVKYSIYNEQIKKIK